jgi:flagella basal body P-ring formation protein FlgA
MTICWLHIFFVLFVIEIVGGSSQAGADCIVHRDSLLTEVKNEIVKYAGKKGYDVIVSLSSVRDITLPDENVSSMYLSVISIEAPRQFVRLNLEFRSGTGKKVRSLPIVARVKWFAPVAVTTSDIDRGETIHSENVSVKKIEVTGIEDYFSSLEELYGMQAKCPLKNGLIITRGKVMSVPLVRNGGRVRLQAKIGNVIVEGFGTARENGAMNELIRVYNDMTKKTLVGKIIDKETVLVSE